MRRDVIPPRRNMPQPRRSKITSPGDCLANVMSRTKPSRHQIRVFAPVAFAVRTWPGRAGILGTDPGAMQPAAMHARKSALPSTAQRPIYLWLN
jgi:hypothetical protein